jgi:hypothetical protein
MQFAQAFTSMQQHAPHHSMHLHAFDSSSLQQHALAWVSMQQHAPACISIH